MTDEPTFVHVTHGPYAGQRLQLSKADASAAISEGWAVDPFKPVKEAEEEKKPEEKAPEPTPEQAERAKIVERAEKAARRLRGDDEEEKQQREQPQQQPQPRPHEQQRDMSPSHGADYQTRSPRPPGTK